MVGRGSAWSTSPIAAASMPHNASIRNSSRIVARSRTTLTTTKNRPISTQYLRKLRVAAPLGGAYEAPITSATTAVTKNASSGRPAGVRSIRRSRLTWRTSQPITIAPESASTNVSATPTRTGITANGSSSATTISPTSDAVTLRVTAQAAINPPAVASAATGEPNATVAPIAQPTRMARPATTAGEPQESPSGQRRPACPTITPAYSSGCSTDHQDAR